MLSGVPDGFVGVTPPSSVVRRMSRQLPVNVGAGCGPAAASASRREAGSGLGCRPAAARPGASETPPGTTSRPSTGEGRMNSGSPASPPRTPRSPSPSPSAPSQRVAFPCASRSISSTRRTELRQRAGERDRGRRLARAALWLASAINRMAEPYPGVWRRSSDFSAIAAFVLLLRGALAEGSETDRAGWRSEARPSGAQSGFAIRGAPGRRAEAGARAGVAARGSSAQRRAPIDGRPKGAERRER